MRVQKLMWIVWPSFLIAGLLVVLVFAVVDPQDIHGLGVLSRQGVYTLSFFVFWGLTVLSSWLTLLLSISSSEVNQMPASPEGVIEHRAEA